MSSKGKGLISYLLGWIGALIVLLAFKDNNKRDVMNAGQGIVISVGNMIISFIGAFVSSYVPFFNLLTSGLFIVILIFAVVNVLTDKDPKLPVIGDITESLFSKQLANAPEVSSQPQAKYDPATGQPINQAPQAKYDPATGQPINQAPQASYDPATGQPINQAPQAKYDPATGQPINQAPQASYDSATGQSISGNDINANQAVGNVQSNVQ